MDSVIRIIDSSGHTRTDSNGSGRVRPDRPLPIPVRVAAVLGCLLASVPFASAEDPRETYQQILAKRPRAEWNTLRERSAPDRQGQVASESFLDLLKLREQPTRQAVPELIGILAAHADSTRIHGFAAAQALHAADTDDAREALQKHVLQPKYAADLAVQYTSHWQMREPQRSKFIAAYLLRDLSEELDVSVRTRWGSEDHAALFVTVELKNASKRPLAISLEQQYQALALHLRAPSGTFVEKQQLVVYTPLRPRWLLLAPGESHSFEVPLELKSDPELLRKFSGPDDGREKSQALLTSGDVGFALREEGEYELAAMFVRTPPSDEQLKFLRDTERIEAGTIWTGRAVSGPVKVTLHLAGGEEG